MLNMRLKSHKVGAIANDLQPTRRIAALEPEVMRLIIRQLSIVVTLALGLLCRHNLGAIMAQKLVQTGIVGVTPATGRMEH